MNDEAIEKLKDFVQDGNINFLFGSGMSASYLSVLGNIEVLLTEASEITNEDDRKIIVASLYKLYFDSVIDKNLNILENDPATFNVLNSYKRFFEILNKIILKRRNTLLSKQINIFTTNIDICLEKSLEDKGFEYIDGFRGNFKPRFDLSNFKKSIFKRSLHFENVSEIPVFNIYKIHGSLTWGLDDNQIIFSNNLEQVRSIKKVALSPGTLIEIEQQDTLTDLQAKSSSLTINHDEIDEFMENYEKLAIVNPTKDKFRETLLNQTYYELLRIYANELEKENTILFVMGFSFSDEHIRELTLRVANSNPTLQIIIFAYNSDARSDLVSKIGASRHNNIQIISPTTDENNNDEFSFTFDEINSRVYQKLQDKILEGL